MIELKNLTKVYRAGGRRRVEALRQVSVAFPERGLVFIVGKSGSGKSTLLNLLSGFDTPTAGEIYVGGKPLSTFSHQEMDAYRAGVLGFVFQDFHLIDRLSVSENVAYPLHLSESGAAESEAVERMLRQVGLEGYGDRRITELSGGECQRVAIARSLIKSPRLILADEPTGNLDSKTSRQVLELLREAAEHVLVVVVSHDLVSAYEFGDRIIELKDGAVLSDRERREGYVNEFSLEDGCAVLPYKKEMTPDQLSALEQAIAEGEVQRVTQLDDGFRDGSREPAPTATLALRRPRLPYAAIRALSGRFLAGQKVLSAMTALLLTLLLTLFGLVQSFALFEGEEVFVSALSDHDQPSVVLYKGVYDEQDGEIDDDHMVSVTSADLEALRACGYGGGIYRLNNFSIPLALSSWELAFGRPQDDRRNLQTLYPAETYGTLVCDMDYLVSAFGRDGQLRVLAGDLADTDGIILTDYVADALLFFGRGGHKTYEELLGDLVIADVPRARVVAVIDTGYKDTYRDFLDQYREIVKKEDMARFKELYRSDTAKAFFFDAVHNLGITYTLNPDFLADCHAYKGAARAGNATFSAHGVSLLSHEDVSLLPDRSGTLSGYGMQMNYALYNRIFGTEYTPENLADFSPVTLTLSRFETYADASDPPILSAEVTVVALCEGTNVASAALYALFDSASVRDFALYLDDPAGLGASPRFLDENVFYTRLESYKVVENIVEIVEVFRDLFWLIVAVAFAVAVLAVSFFTHFIVRKNRQNIGILRSLGTSNADLTAVFARQLLCVTACVFALTAAAYFGVVRWANRILQGAFLSLFEHSIVEKITLVSPSLWALLADLLLVLAVCAIAVVLEMVQLRRVDVIRIIKARE